MFYRGEFVKSRFHGLGRVVTGSEMPTILFLDCRRCSIPGDTLSVVTEESYFAEVENRSRLERWLNFSVYGIRERPKPMLREGRFDLATAMIQSITDPFGQAAGTVDEIRPVTVNDVVFD